MSGCRVQYLLKYARFPVRCKDTNFCLYAGHIDLEETGRRKFEIKIHLYETQRKILNKDYVLKLSYKSK